MTIRSIFSVDVDDAKFKKFKESFDQYQKLLKSSPSEWKKVTDNVGGSREAAAGIVAAQAASLAAARAFGHVQQEAAARSRTLADDWHKLAGHAKSFAGHITSATRSLLSWGAWTTLAGGLLGVGGLWGIERLAQAASFGRRSSLGLGLTFGEQRAFGINYGRVVDPGQFLGGVNQALHDLTARPALYGAGLTEADIRGRDTGGVASLVIQRLKPLLDRTPSSQLGQLLQARQLGQLGLTVQDLERIKALSPSELGEYAKHYGSDAVRLNLTQRELVAWQRLQVQLTRSGDTIEATLIRGLTPLAPELRKLSQGFTDVVQAFLGSKDVRHWIDLAAKGLEQFAHYIGTPQFKSDVEWLAHGISEFAKAVIEAAKKLGGFFGLNAPAGSPSNPATGSGDTKPAQGGWGFNWPKGRWEYQGGTGDSATPPNGGQFHPGDPGWKYDPKQQRWLYQPSSFGAIEGANGLPGGVLGAVYRQESGGNPWARNARTGAAGGFGFMPATWAQYGGGGSPYDPTAAAQAAGRYLRVLMQEFGGSIDKALAAYNWGPGHLEADIRRWGNAWRQHLPGETQNYLNRILPQIGGGGGKVPQVVVIDRTGGSVVISGAQLAV